jgi:uncharacterized protein YjbI with pentapeptide repeats
MRSMKVTCAALAIAAIFLFATVVATIQGEEAEVAAGWFDQWFPGRSEPLSALRSFLFDGAVSAKTQRPASLFARRLVMPDEDFVTENDTALEGTRRTLALRARDLRYAVRDRVDLKKADFAYARLEGVSLVGAQLQGARFEGSNMRHVRLDIAQLQGAVFESLDLTDSGFRGANLQGATFHHVDLHGANLSGAGLQGGAINESSLLGADFRFSRLQGADFRRTALRATNFMASRMEGTDFREANLRGARFDGFAACRLTPAGDRLCEPANIWRSRGLAPEVFDHRAIRATAPTEDRSALVQEWLASIPKGPLRDEAARRLSAFVEPGDDDQFAVSRTLNRLDPERMAGWFADTICPKEGSPYTWGVIEYLSPQPRVLSASTGAWTGSDNVRTSPPYAAAVARSLLDKASSPDICPGLQDLSEDYRRSLQSKAVGGW